MSLTDTIVRNAKPREKPYKLGDEKGLYLRVNPNGSKLWKLKYRVANKEKKLALGAYPEVTLAMAREQLVEARRLLRNDVDPGEQKKQAKRAAMVAAANSFEAVAREWFAKFSTKWAESHSCKVLLRLDNDLIPWLGSRPISSIEADELLVAIRRVENRGALDSAHRCLGTSSQIFRYAIATSRAKRNPAADLRGALPPVPDDNHFPSITDPDQVGELLRAIDGYKGNFTTCCALRLAPLVFLRPINLRKAEWVWVDWKAGLMRIPGAAVKMREDLIVPLSSQALVILQELYPLTGHGRYLFPCEGKKGQPMSGNTVNGALRRLGYATDEEMTGHGFRAMARTILDEVLGFRVEWIDMQLAHKVKDPNGRAYNRTAFLDGRRQMMQGWADYLDQLRSNKVVVPIVRDAARFSESAGRLTPADFNSSDQPRVHFSFQPAHRAGSDLDTLGKPLVGLHLINH
jgi:integrase